MHQRGLTPQARQALIVAATLVVLLGVVIVLGVMLRRFPHKEQLGRTQAHLLWRAGRTLAAHRMFSKLSRAMPADVGLKQMLAQAQATVGFGEEAMVTAEEAVALAPGRAHILDTLATAYWANGYRDQALAVGRRALALAPVDHEMYRQRLERFSREQYSDVSRFEQ